GDCAASCDSTKAALASNAKGDCAASCDSTKAALASNAKGDCAASCDSTKAALASNAKGDCAATCDGAQAVTYTVYDCSKCDSLARVAARSYMNMLVELKSITGTEACPAEAAQQALAAVMKDMQAEQMAKAATVETTTVSLGAVSEKAESCSASCKK
ncbi:MAG: hypothetical protein AAF432_15005, partial [Planctomycetota bacterium]